MKNIVILSILAVLVSGCNFQFGRADLTDGELYVSESGMHTFAVDGDNIYSFEIKLGTDFKIYDRKAEKRFEKEQELRSKRINAQRRIELDELYKNDTKDVTYEEQVE